MNRLFGLGTRGVLVVVPAVFIAAFFLYPIATILWRGLGGGGGETFLDLAASSRQRDIAWFTIWQAIASSLLTLAVGIPAASAVARLSARRRRRDATSGAESRRARTQAADRVDVDVDGQHLVDGLVNRLSIRSLLPQLMGPDVLRSQPIFLATFAGRLGARERH